MMRKDYVWICVYLQLHIVLPFQRYKINIHHRIFKKNHLYKLHTCHQEISPNINFLCIILFPKETINTDTYPPPHPTLSLFGTLCCPRPLKIQRKNSAKKFLHKTFNFPNLLCIILFPGEKTQYWYLLVTNHNQGFHCWKNIWLF